MHFSSLFNNPYRQRKARRMYNFYKPIKIYHLHWKKWKIDAKFCKRNTIVWNSSKKWWKIVNLCNVSTAANGSKQILSQYIWNNAVGLASHLLEKKQPLISTDKRFRSQLAKQSSNSLKTKRNHTQNTWFKSTLAKINGRSAKDTKSLPNFSKYFFFYSDINKQIPVHQIPPFL